MLLWMHQLLLWVDQITMIGSTNWYFGFELLGTQTIKSAYFRQIGTLKNAIPLRTFGTLSSNFWYPKWQNLRTFGTQGSTNWYFELFKKSAFSPCGYCVCEVLKNLGRYLQNICRICMSKKPLPFQKGAAILLCSYSL